MSKKLEEMTLWELSELMCWCIKKKEEFCPVDADPELVAGVINNYSNLYKRAQLIYQRKSIDMCLEQFWNEKGE